MPELYLSHADTLMLQFSAKGVLDTAFGFRRGLTEKTFGAVTDLAFGGRLLLDASMRYWVTGWAEFAHEREVAVLRYEGPAGASGCAFGSADSCVCIGEQCLVQSAGPIHVTHDLELRARRYLVNADVIVEGLRWQDGLSSTIVTHGVVSFTNASVLTLETPMIGTFTPFATSRCSGQFGAVVVNQTSPILRTCQQFVATQRLLSDSVLTMVVSIGRLTTVECGGGGSTTSEPPLAANQSMSAGAIVAIVLLAMAVSAVGAMFVSFLIRKYRMEGSRSLKAKTIKMAATNEYKRMI